MADNRKYYYLKLKENFFDGDAIVLLENMPDGILYSNILLKLYLKSLKSSGKLQLDEHMPYTAQIIATLTRHQIGTVERALKIFLQLGLVEQLADGLLYMTDIELMIGQSSTEAERKRAARLQNKALLPERTNGGQMSDICPPEIEIKKEIEKEIDIEREGETGHPAPYGSYGNVFLTDDELEALKAELPTKWTTTSSGFPAISLPQGRSTKTTPPLSAAGRRMTGRKRRANGSIHTRRARAYE